MPNTFPQRALDPVPNNLPIQLTSFVGRERELAAIEELLGRSRLVTVTGTGGAGKTRLALQLAVNRVDAYPDGVWFVDLAPLSKQRLVHYAVHAALGLKETAGQSPLEALIDYLRGRTALLLLDNCEHVLDSCARLADDVLHACPRVRILATSREMLGLFGEAAWRVPSLSLPPDDRSGTAGGGSQSVAESEAVRLFVDRIRLVQPDFVVSDENASAVARVCRRLDGMPLGIELAAARVRTLSVHEVAERLDDRFRLLAGGSRTALRRQQTLAATVAWSYDLLAPPERLLFDRLSVFSGGCTLEAVENVGVDDGVDKLDVLDLVAHLVDKSLVLAEEDYGGTTRYRLLETLRQYGAERLLESGQARALRDRHAAYYLALAEQGIAEMHASGAITFATWMERLNADIDNLRAALNWSVEHGQAERALRTFGELSGFWYRRDRPSEGRALVEELLSAEDAGARTTGRGRALTAAVWIALHQLDLEEAAKYGREAASILRDVGDREGEAHALWTLGYVAIAGGDYSSAGTYGEQGLTVLGGVGRAFLTAGLFQLLGQASYYRGEYAAAHAHLETAIRIEGASTRTPGDLDWLGHVAVALGELDVARARYAEALEHRRLVPSPVGYALTLCGLAMLAATKGQHTRAARLAGAAAAICEQSGVRPERTQQAGFKERLAVTRGALGEQRFAACWAQGRAMTLEQAVAEALEDPPTEHVAPGTLTDAPARSSGLTSREREVAILVAHGLSNRQIADTLVFGERTAEAHVGHCLAKLGLVSRTQLAAWTVAHGLLEISAPAVRT